MQIITVIVKRDFQKLVKIFIVLPPPIESVLVAISSNKMLEVDSITSSQYVYRKLKIASSYRGESCGYAEGEVRV